MTEGLAGKHLHLDCYSGLSGDMFLGACLDLGTPLEVVADAVRALDLHGISVESRAARRGGFAGTRFRVLDHGKPIDGPDPEEEASLSSQKKDKEEARVGTQQENLGSERGLEGGRAHAHGDGHAHEHSHGHSGEHPHEHSQEHALGQSRGHGRHLSEIRELLRKSALSVAVRDRAIVLFERLGEAEAKAHGVPVERIHFHEVGAVDSIVDLVGAAAAISWLAPARVSCGPVNLGAGEVSGAHGRMPVPPPAVARLVRGLPVYQSDGFGVGELLTPTGAVLLAELVDDFVPMPALVVDAVGYGLGRKEIAGRFNSVRLVAGHVADAAGDVAARVVVVECELDDLPGEGFGFLLERLLAEGALDVYFTSIQMKKNRPGTLVTLLAREADFERLAGILLAESGSLGCRFAPMSRFEAAREIVEVATELGPVSVKRARFRGRTIAESPEYESCRRIALARGVAWREVYRAAVVAIAASKDAGDE